MYTLPPGIRVRENSWLARIAACKLKSRQAALVWGSTIHLHGITLRAFLANAPLMKHELKHVAQYRHYGHFGFLVRYLWYSLRYGYYQNPLEIEARAAENA